MRQTRRNLWAKRIRNQSRSFLVILSEINLHLNLTIILEFLSVILEVHFILKNLALCMLFSWVIALKVSQPQKGRWIHLKFLFLVSLDRFLPKCKWDSQTQIEIKVFFYSYFWQTKWSLTCLLKNILLQLFLEKRLADLIFIMQEFLQWLYKTQTLSCLD